MNCIQATRFLASVNNRTEATQHVAAGDFIPVSSWGKDHWSTLLYAESVAVDANGQIRNGRMRTGFHNSDLLDVRMYAHRPSEHPSRLKEGERPGHDDWDCLLDLHGEGMIDFPEVVYDDGDDSYTVTISMTDRGASVAADLRRHKMNGGNYATFSVPTVGV